MEQNIPKYIYIRGDTKDLYFKIKKPDDTYVDGSEYSEIEVQINPQKRFTSIKKLKTKGEVEWMNNRFYCRLSQEDTFKTQPGINTLQVRLYENEECKGTYIYDFLVGDVLSKEVISDGFE